jgi:hypothetical protein
MKLIEEHVNNKNKNFNFWSGYDKEIIENHPSDGSKGYAIVFIEKDELLNILKEKNLSNIRELNIPFVFLYEVPIGFNQFDDLIRKFKMKFNQPFKGIFTV